MERSTFALYPRELQILYDRANSLLDCLLEFPPPRQRERAATSLARLNVWLVELRRRARWFRESMAAIGAAIDISSRGPDRTLSRLLLWADRFNQPGGLNYLVAVDQALRLRHFPHVLKLTIEEEIAAIYVVQRDTPKWKVEGDGGAQARNALFIRWHDNEGMKAAAILDRWNAMPDGERQQRFPRKWQPLAYADGKGGEARRRYITQIISPGSRKILSEE